MFTATVTRYVSYYIPCRIYSYFASIAGLLSHDSSVAPLFFFFHLPCALSESLYQRLYLSVHFASFTGILLLYEVNNLYFCLFAFISFI